MSYLDTIPKTLPITDPLLFSFLMILDSLKATIRFNGNYARSVDKLLPAFEYGVNKWQVIGQTDKGSGSPNGIYQIESEVTAAFWTEKPPFDAECNEDWAKYPDGTAVNEHSFAAKYHAEFEAWRIETSNTLQAIINGLVAKGAKHSNVPPRGEILYLADIFGWEIIDNKVSFVYAQDSTANKFYGVGAVFTLRGNYQNCCPTPDLNILTKSYFESKGFIFR